jgi:hypothetical protein
LVTNLEELLSFSTTGHIISSLGPYFSDGKNNDANILIHGQKTNAEDMSNWLREGNIVVVDRGFPEREWLGLHDPQIRY